MVLIVACSLANRFPKWTPQMWWLGAVSTMMDRRRNVLLGILLAIHAASGVGANVAGAFLPFSAARATADYIRRELPPDVIPVGVDDYCTSTVSAYLGREFYDPEMHCFAPFNTQDDRQRGNLDANVRHGRYPQTHWRISS